MYECMYACMYVCMQVGRYVCMYACMRVCGWMDDGRVSGASSDEPTHQHNDELLTRILDFAAQFVQDFPVVFAGDFQADPLSYASLADACSTGRGSTLWPPWPLTTPVPLRFAVTSTGPLRSLLLPLTRSSSVSMRSISWSRPASFRSVAISTPLSLLRSLPLLRPLVLSPLRPLPPWT